MASLAVVDRSATRRPSEALGFHWPDGGLYGLVRDRCSGRAGR
jgi:hypothetical protein